MKVIFSFKGHGRQCFWCSRFHKLDWHRGRVSGSNIRLRENSVKRITLTFYVLIKYRIQTKICQKNNFEILCAGQLSDWDKTQTFSLSKDKLWHFMWLSKIGLKQNLLTDKFWQKDKLWPKLRWVGNGECFLFSIQPKMAIFHSTGKVNEHQRIRGTKIAQNVMISDGHTFTML